MTRARAAREAKAAREAAEGGSAASASTSASAGAVVAPTATLQEQDAPEVPADVQAAVDAGRVDELFMLLGKAPPGVRNTPAYKEQKKALIKAAEANKAKKRAAAKAVEVS